VERLARSAAEALRAADVLLVATGAGFSADSGLATYDVRSVNQRQPTANPKTYVWSFIRLRNPKRCPVPVAASSLRSFIHPWKPLETLRRAAYVVFAHTGHRRRDGVSRAWVGLHRTVPAALGAHRRSDVLRFLGLLLQRLSQRLPARGLRHGASAGVHCAAASRCLPPCLTDGSEVRRRLQMRRWRAQRFSPDGAAAAVVSAAWEAAQARKAAARAEAMASKASVAQENAELQVPIFHTSPGKSWSLGSSG